MTLSNETLNKRLQPYPHLQRVLGSRWIAEQDEGDPVESPFLLARRLRTDGSKLDSTTFDSILRKLEDIAGIANRRRRIRADAPALIETVTELYFDAWLKDEGCTLC